MKHILKRTITLLLALIMALSLIPMPNAEAAALNQGSSGAQVKRLQQNLIGLGYLSGSADGIFGGMTRSAVIAYQYDNGLAADGVAGDMTQASLKSTVIRLQTELKAAGFNPGTADGQFGGNTRNALLGFQTAQGLKQTGAADNATWSRLSSGTSGMNASSTLRRGSSGTQVKYLQMALITFGYLSGSADGVFGGGTQSAVMKYQADHGLGSDGVAGPVTLTALKNDVLKLQNELAKRGYYYGAIDGICGDGVRSAVIRYQSAVGLTADGVAGSATLGRLYGTSFSGTVYKTWIDSLYQDGDFSQIWYYNGGRKYTTVQKSGCGGVALAMALNAMLDTREYTGQSVMQWFADHGYYAGNGTYQSGLIRYPQVLGLGATYCDRSSTLISHLKQGRLAIAIIKDRTGEALFTYTGSDGHFILISGYRVSNGKDQIFVNNPLSWKATGWFDVTDLMENVLDDQYGYEDSFVVIYK